MTLYMPIGRVNLPTVIKSQPNGAVDPALLRTVEPNRTALVFLMAEFPARGMRAWHADALKQGILMSTTGRGRTLQQQIDLFLSRYTTTYLSGRPTKIWNGVTYWQLPNTAMAATPGTSNHGFWCADDLAEVVNGATVGLRASTLQYLYGTGVKFGFTWETTSETWHVTWMNGDVIPDAVLAYEAGPAPVPIPVPEPVDPIYNEDMRLYRDARFGNIFLVNGDVTTVGPNLFASYRSGTSPVPLIVDVHDASLFSFMRKAQLKVADMAVDGASTAPLPLWPADLK